METFKILWLEDDFKDYWRDCFDDYPSLQFDIVKYWNECERKIIDNVYHAVIFDAQGYADASSVGKKSPNKDGLIKLLALAHAKSLPTYIFSGEIDIDSNQDASLFLELLKNNYRLIEGKHIFKKESGVDTILDQIERDLKSNYQYYVKHRYLLDFFTYKWIGNECKSTFLDPIMENFSKHNVDYARGNHMRNLVEQMLEEVNNRWLNGEARKGVGHARAIVDLIKTKKLESSELIVGALYHMVEMSNGESHSAWADDREIRELFFDSDYSAFFLVTKWFHNLMVNFAVLDNHDMLDNGDMLVKSAEQVGHDRSECSVLPDKIVKPIRSPKTNEREFPVIATLPTFKERGKTFVNLKVQVPWKYADCTKVSITGVSKNSQIDDVGYAICSGAPND